MDSETMDATNPSDGQTHAAASLNGDRTHLETAERVVSEFGTLTQAESVSRRINSETVMLIGWGPAILMQFAHPLVAAGVADHSAFATTPTPATRLRRLHGTLSAMLDITFGTPEQVARATEGINRIHDYVHGHLGETVGVFSAGTWYSAHDPELLRWVHATLSFCLPRTYELYVGPLTEEEKDRYCLEASLAAPLLGIPENYLPTNWAELEEYMERMVASGQIAVGRDARELAHELLSPLYPRVLWPLYWPARLAMFGVLPPSIRQAYGFPWSEGHERALRSSAALVRYTLPVLPSLVRHWPAARRFGRSHGSAG